MIIAITTTAVINVEDAKLDDTFHEATEQVFAAAAKAAAQHLEVEIDGGITVDQEPLD